MSTQKKNNTPLIILLAFLALAAIGTAGYHLTRDNGTGKIKSEVQGQSDVENPQESEGQADDYPETAPGDDEVDETNGGYTGGQDAEDGGDIPEDGGDEIDSPPPILDEPEEPVKPALAPLEVESIVKPSYNIGQNISLQSNDPSRAGQQWKIDGQTIEGGKLDYKIEKPGPHTVELFENGTSVYKKSFVAMVGPNLVGQYINQMQNGVLSNNQDMIVNAESDLKALTTRDFRAVVQEGNSPTENFDNYRDMIDWLLSEMELSEDEIYQSIKVENNTKTGLLRKIIFVL